MFRVTSKEHQKWIVGILRFNTAVVLTRDINKSILKQSEEEKMEISLCLM